MAEEVLRRLVERGDRDRQRQTDQAQSIKATQYIGNGYVQQIGQAPTRSRYLGNAGLVPGELVAPLGHGQQDVVIHKKPVAVAIETEEEETIELFDTFKMTIVTDGENQSYTVNIASGTSPRITIDWKDGTIETFTTTGQKTHIYNSPGTYIAELWGSFESGGNLQLGSNASNAFRLKAVSEFPFIEGLDNFVLSFEDCTGLTTIPPNLFRYNTSANSFYGCFSNCTGLTGSIPSDLFRYNTLATSFYACLNNCTGLTGSIPPELFRYNTLATNMGFCLSQCTGLTGNIPADLFRYNTLATSFVACLYRCSGLTGSIPPELFRYNTLATDMGFCFSNCTGLTGNIPSDLFRYNTLATSFYACLNNCTGLTGSIPPELFRYNTLATNMGFCLSQCTGLTGNIPADLFRYNTLATSFVACLYRCSGLTGSIPPELFRYNTLATDMGFCFSNCTGLTGNIPADLFRYNTLATSLVACFQSCSGLTGYIPNGLFRYNTLVTDFGYCLFNCFGLRFSSDIFSPSSEYSTRFAGKSVNFTYAFQLIGYTGGSGVAPALWLYTFGSSIKTGCFAGVSVSTATNYADIPLEWR